MAEVNPEKLLDSINGMDDGPEKDRAVKLLASLREHRERNPLYYYNHPTLSAKPPHKRQLLFHAFKTKVKNFFGGNQSGKTTAGLADDIIQAVDEDILPEHLRSYKKFDPPFHCRIYAPNLSVLELGLYEKIKELCPREQLVGDSWEKAFDKQMHVLRFKNGSMFQFRTYMQDPFAAGGVTIHRVHFDEEPPREHMIEARFRVARYGGDILYTLTPLKGLTWAYDELYEERGPLVGDVPNHFINEDLSMGTVIVDMDDNPYLGEEEKADALRGLSDEERRARKSGEFVHIAGLIYQDFDKQLHVIAPFELPENVNVIEGIDPGLRNRCAVLFTFVVPDGTMYVFDELYEQGKTVGEVANQIHRVNTQYGIVPSYNVIDPAARNKNHQTGRSDQMEYADHGVLCIPGQNAVEAGINRVRERFQKDKLFIFSNCTNLIKELQRYRWREAPRTGEDGKPIPMKVDDHAVDCLRYIVMSRPYLPEEIHERHETQKQRMMREDQERFSTDDATPAIFKY